MPRPSAGDRKDLKLRLPLEVFEAFEAKRAEAGLGQNEAGVLAIKRWLRPPDAAAPAEPSPRAPRAPATLSEQATAGLQASRAKQAKHLSATGGLSIPVGPVARKPGSMLIDKKRKSPRG
jgi:hypothetical protein